MRNIWTIFKDDIKRVSSNVMSMIIVIGLVVMPSIFTWYNVIACWNVFENTGNLTVAVANVDEGYESDLLPLRVNVGEQVISELRANDEIDWVFTSEDDAIDGARSGRYYAAVVIPQSFSRDMLTFYSDDVEHAQIIYYANEKKSAIAPKITDKGADSVSYQVNEVFAETLSELALGIADSLSSYAADADTTSQIAVLADHVRSLADQMDQVSSVLVLYGSLANTSSDLINSSTSLVATARDEAKDLMNTAPGEAESINSLVDTLKHSVSGLSSAMESTNQDLTDISTQIDSLFDTAATSSTTAASSMRTQAQVIDQQVADYREVASELEGLLEVVPDDYKPAIQSTVDMINAACDLLSSTSTNLKNAADKLETGNADVQAEHDQIKAQIAQAQQSVSEMKRTFEEDLAPHMDELAADAGAFVGYVSDGVTKLDSIGNSLSGSVGSLSTTLSNASSKIQDASNDLTDAGANLRTLADDIDTALASGDADALREVLGSDVQSLSQALAAPVGVDRIVLYPSENFGSAMAPLYTTLALFIGSLLILVVVKPAVSTRAQQRLHNPKPRELFLGRFGIMSCISLLQTTLMGLGNMFFLQVQVAEPLLFMLCFWAAGLVFTFLIYALVATFANLGKAVAVLLLIIQVTGCGGSFPLQILPGFIQTISPFLPATHVVNAMRNAMFGTFGNDYWIQMGQLALFLIPAAILGLALRKPLSKFMTWYVGKVEDSKLIG